MPKSNECIEERDDSYRVKIAYYDELGNRKFYSKSFSVKKYGTRQKALEFARKHRDEKKVELANGMIIQEKHYSLDEIYKSTMDLYQCTLETKRKLNLLYNKYISNVIGGSKDFKTIKYQDIQKSLNDMVSQSSDDTIQRVMSIWKKIYRYAIASDIVLKDETYNVSIPKSDKVSIAKPMETSFSEILEICEKIEDSIQNKRDSLLYQSALMIMYFGGLRPAETFALCKQNVSIDERNMFVCESVGTTSTEINVIRKPKNEHSIRNVPMREELVPVFQTLFNETKDNYLFIRDNGKLMNGTDLSNTTRRFRTSEFTPYASRHQFSTDLIRQGYDLRTIQELMGHANSSMTLSYARSNEKQKRLAMNQVIKS